MPDPLVDLRSCGQSIWLDDLGRELLKSGLLSGLIEDGAVSGLTSNPTILQKALNNDKIYDEALHILVDKGETSVSLYESLVVSDVREAADALRGIYEASKGEDGYVSLEVSPRLAYDVSGTISEAKRLYDFVDRPNLMIKVPTTLEGVAAGKVLLAEGINVNFTLIFSLIQYREVVEAYLEGMAQLIESGGDASRIHSVASFFVSRIDTVVDERLKEATAPAARATLADLFGKASIANARLAYAHFEEAFSGDKFLKLQELGMSVQKILWASTSTKNPSYPDTYYVDNLLWPQTINTLPLLTLNAYRDHGSLEKRTQMSVEQAKKIFERLESLHLNIDEITERLLEDGIRAFADSYENLLEDVSKKRMRLLRGYGHRSASLGALQKIVDERLITFDREKITERIWNCEPDIWTNDESGKKEIAQRLGWLQVVETMVGEKGKLRDFASEIRDAGFETAVLIGMGGSSLAPEVFAKTYGVSDGFIDLKVLDTTIPTSILELERSLDLSKTLFIISSKSGGTIEVMSLFKYFRQKMSDLLGENYGTNFIAITDPGTSLGKLASSSGFRKIFLNPPDIGGRFSALSYFGLVPASLLGLDIDFLLTRASQAAEASGSEAVSLESPGAWLGVIMGEASLHGRDKLTLIMSPCISSFGCWLEQLIAESTGKEGKGIIPIDLEPVGVPEAYDNDRLFIYMRVDGDFTFDRAVSDLERAGHPVVTLRLHHSYDLGREIFRYEFATASAGVVLGINPFDQPNVQESKDITSKLLSAFVEEGKAPDAEKMEPRNENFRAEIGRFLDCIKPHDYVAFNAFIHPSQRATELLQEARQIIRDRFQVATTLGFGPRYLHSTGQIHKGGADKGVFIVITSDEKEDIQVPGEKYSFGTLKQAQSIGDFQALRNKGRRVIRIHLGEESDLERLIDAIKGILI